MALFVVGGTIAALRRGDLGLEIAPIVLGKLVLHPLAVTGAFLLVPGVPPELVARIGRDQLEDYAVRRGVDLATAERWLRPNLD